MARQFRVSVDTVHRWIHRAGTSPLDQVDFRDRSRAPKHIRRTALEVEESILLVRKQLKESSDLGEFGAAAIHRDMQERGLPQIPSIPTINRILRRRGAFDYIRRQRWPAPPLGWYLPDLASRKAEMDCFDIVEGLTIQGGIPVDVLNGISLHGGLVGSWPQSSISASIVLKVLQGHWEEVGCPAYVQFDNDTRFQGPHNNPDVLGRVPRFCLQLGVTPVFTPPRETGFQAAIEAYNGRWQLKVWRRFHHDTMEMLLGRSERYVHAYRRRLAERIEAAPPRRAFPDSWSVDFQRQLAGRVIFIRRTTDSGTVKVLERNYEVDPHWIQRLVRAEVDLTAGVIRFYALRRREPLHHRLLKESPYHTPQRRFRG